MKKTTLWLVTVLFITATVITYQARQIQVQAKQLEPQQSIERIFELHETNQRNLKEKLALCKSLGYNVPYSLVDSDVCPKLK